MWYIIIQIKGKYKAIRSDAKTIDDAKKEIENEYPGSIYLRHSEIRKYTIEELIKGVRIRDIAYKVIRRPDDMKEFEQVLIENLGLRISIPMNEGVRYKGILTGFDMETGEFSMDEDTVDK